ncbi:MAG: FitA-like ribbon-helix-helix domain-containing protein [Inhella sp.]
MSALSIRNLPEVTHQALRLRAAANGRSTEAEVRSILEAAVAPQQGGLAARMPAAALRHGVPEGFPELPKGKPVRPADFG